MGPAPNHPGHDIDDIDHFRVLKPMAFPGSRIGRFVENGLKALV